jgi:hypothetical protein
MSALEDRVMPREERGGLGREERLYILFWRWDGTIVLEVLLWILDNRNGRGRGQ